MRVIAISADERDDAADMAARYGIDFPLVSDEGLEISRQYVGVDDNGFAVPGTFIVGADGRILFRSIGATKDDRVFAAELVARLDELVGGTDPQSLPAVRGGFAAWERRQLRLGLALSATRVSAAGAADTGASSSAQLLVLQPLSRAVMIGAAVAAGIGKGDRLDADMVLRLRHVFSGELAELYAQVPVGVSYDGDRLGWNSGAAFGLQFAFYPSLAFHLEAGLDLARFSADSSLASTTHAAGRLGLGAALLF